MRSVAGLRWATDALARKRVEKIALYGSRGDRSNLPRLNTGEGGNAGTS